MSMAMATHAAPSTSASSAHDSNDLPHVTRQMAFPKSDIRVNIRDHSSSKIYSSGAPVAGDVTITTKRDVRFDSIQIVLIGNTKSSFQGLSFPQEITHTFLKMIMPIPETTYPVPRILETDQTYTIPFNFVIPNQLTINACQHKRLSEQLQDHHVLLPPSLGGWEKDDMAPHMAKVEYVIKARVLKETEVGGKKTRIMEATQQIQVLPASNEEPPLNITEKDTLYKMTKTKKMRKNFLSGTLGRVTVTAHQPGAAVLTPDGSALASIPTARINLSFDPESPVQDPPKITSISGKVTAHTYFSSGTISTFPNLGEWNQPYLTDRRGQFFMSAPLPAMTVPEQPKWTSRMSSPARRDSGYGSETSGSTQALMAKNTKNKSPVYMTSFIDVPFSLPTDKKILVPSFHSCIASRVYTLTLSVGIAAKKGSSTTVNVTVPLQIAVKGTAEAAARSGSGAGLPSFEEVAADEHLRPRVLHTLGDRDSAIAVDDGALPGYADVGGNAPQPAEIPEGDRLPGYGETGHRRRFD
ncbi:hypothetical protein QBC35DRAFT_743 [Podospora australis]|uniref:Arrestin n=1 Tax=Podospora australis TaxID=1536484 RepID=A0AAN6X5U4_9PEZI|nr:hypothetical protein QBC35DRAFT_743 [Podospora australis]